MHDGTSSVVSACLLDCPDACSFLVDPGARTIRANPEHPFTNGLICSKGKRLFQRLDAPERITRPLVRKQAKRGLRRGKQAGPVPDGFEPVSWEAVLELIAGKLNRMADRPEAVLHIRGHGYRGVLAQASLNFFAALGASTTHGSLCDDAGIEACIRDFGSLEHNDPLDLLNANRIVNWGKDLRRSSPHTGLLVRTARTQGTRVLTISPGGDGSEHWSDQVIRIRPGTDRLLAAWVIQKLLERERISLAVIQAVFDWEGFQSLLRGLKGGDLLRACDVKVGQAEALLDWYASPETADGPTATLIGWGLQRYRFGGQNVRFINALALLSGHIGRAGGGAYFNIASGRCTGAGPCQLQAILFAACPGLGSGMGRSAGGIRLGGRP